MQTHLGGGGGGSRCVFETGLLFVESALGLEVTTLSVASGTGSNLGLPGRSTEVLDAVGVLEDGLSLLKSLTGSLGEEESDVNEGSDVEDTEDDVGLPGDVLESDGDEETESSIEGPVGRGSQRGTLAAKTEREQLRGVSPGDGTPGGSKRGDKEVGDSDESLGGGTRHEHRLGQISTNTIGLGNTVDSKKTSGSEHPESHEHGSDEQSRAATPLVHPDKSRNGHEDVDDVGDGGGEEVGLASVASHGEDSGDVVHW